jgi:serpin B
MKTFPSVALLLLAPCTALQAADSKVAAGAVNALGVDLYRQEAHGAANLLLSPYSIQNALAMTYAGAAGDTQAEMQRVLHYPADENALDASFATLANELADAARNSVQRVAESKKYGGPATPIEFNLANRLFAEKDYAFRRPFLDLVRDRFGAPLQPMDYKNAADKAREIINHWVEEQTKHKIRDLIPPGALTPKTRLTLVNALYLRAPWGEQFSDKATKPDRFLAHGKEGVMVPTMLDQSECRYAKREGYQVVARSYYGGQLQFVILLPDNPAGLPELEKALTAKMLEECVGLPEEKVILHLPKFRLEPPTMPLSDDLKALGMKTAFDDPRGSANFDRMAPRKPDDYLAISAVLHKTFLALDEKGTEAAAATAVVMVGAALAAPGPKPQPIEVRVDHPFLFAIQHVPSGACLFLGRVTDPR